MDSKRMSRRAFSQMVAGAVLSGGVLEAAVQETQSQGSLSEETALTLLKHMGYEPTLPDEMKTLKPMLETTIRDLKTIRDFDLPVAVEPAFVFHADK